MSGRGKVQLDVTDPIRERVIVPTGGKTGTGTGKRHRLMLNNAEIDALAKRDLYDKVAGMFFEQGVTLPTIAEELKLPVWKLSGPLLHDKSLGLRQRMLDKMVDMFLERAHTMNWAEIQNTCGLSERQLREVIKSDDFLETWAAEFMEITRHPNLKVAPVIVVEEFLPLAMQQWRRELTDPDVPWSIRDKAIERALSYAGVGKVSAQESDRQAAAKLLEQHGIRVDKAVILVSPEYEAAEEATRPPEVVEGQAREVADQQ